MVILLLLNLQSDAPPKTEECYTIKSCNQLSLGYEYDDWYLLGKKTPITVDFSINTNKHTIISGLSGSGKTVYTHQYLTKIFLLGKDYGIKILFADFKGDDAYSHLRNCENYFFYNSTLDALDIIYEILHQRQIGNDTSRTPVFLIWEEYLANILFLKTQDKKKAERVMQQVAEILAIGRSLNCNLCIVTQTAYASMFPEGAKSNFGIIVICGAPLKSIYELLIPKDYIDEISNKPFKTGEGVILLQGSEMHCMKVPWIQNEKLMHDLCVKALST